MLNDKVTEAVDRYLAVIRKHSAGVSPVERDEFIEEIRGHILDRIIATNGLTQDRVADLLRSIGDPKKLAAEFKTQVMLHHAAKSISPWLMLRSTLRWGMTGFAGAVALLITLVGYGCTLISFLCILLKPFLPDHIGLWLGPDRTITLGYWNRHLVGSEAYGISVRPPFDFVLGTLGRTNGPVHDLAGQNIYTIGLLCGVAFLIATTLFARWMITRFASRKRRHSLTQETSQAQPRYAE